MSIRITSVNKTFGKFSALRDVSLEIQPGELLALLGPSGSGKTTLLRIIAGLESPDDGPSRIEFDDVDVTTHSAYQRKAGFVFQHYALFQHMNVFENIAFGLRVRPKKTRPSEEEIAKRVGELLDLVHLGEFAKRFPSQLSGGQRQRIALARALAIDPKILLLDEPFGALDARVRMELCKWLRTFHDETKITSLFVTHDQDEAFRLADRVVIFGEGRIRQIGTPAEVRGAPADDFVQSFLGFGEDLHPGAMV